MCMQVQVPNWSCQDCQRLGRGRPGEIIAEHTMKEYDRIRLRSRRNQFRVHSRDMENV